MIKLIQSHRVHKENQVYYQLSRSIVGKREISEKAKMRVYKTIFQPVLMYGTESLTLLDKHRSRFQSCEMRYLRRAAGRTRRDRVRNTTIRAQFQQDSITEAMERKALGWYGHMVRMKEDRKPREVMEARPEGRRGRGRPRLEWEGYVERLAARRGLSMNDVKRLAQNRREYRKWLVDPDA